MPSIIFLATVVFPDADPPQTPITYDDFARVKFVYGQFCYGGSYTLFTIRFVPGRSTSSIDSFQGISTVSKNLNAIHKKTLHGFLTVE